MAVKKFNCGQSAGKAFDMKLISQRIGNYLSGFADGEGSFNISVINREKDYKHGWKISLCFNISQKDDIIPKLFRDTIRCGTIRYRKDGICYFDVRKVNDLVEIIVPFFQRFQLLSGKNKVFNTFCKALKIVSNKKHLTKNGIGRILKLRSLIVVGRKRKYSNKEILDSYQKNPQRLYAKPSTQIIECSDDIVRSLWRHKGSRQKDECNKNESSKGSVIPCRVSSGPHERLNDQRTVSRSCPVKMQHR